MSSSTSTSSSSSSWYSSGRESNLNWWLDDGPGGGGTTSAESFRSEENERDCVVYLIDCHHSMFDNFIKDGQSSSSHSMVVDSSDEEEEEKKHQHNSSDKRTLFEAVCQCVVNSLKRKIVQSKDDQVSVVLFNHKTHNAMNHQRIDVLSPCDVPSAQLMRTLRKLPLEIAADKSSKMKKKEQSECDLRELLWTVQNLLSEADVSSKKFGSKRVFIFTANDDPRCSDRLSTIAKANDMSDSGIDILVVPMGGDGSGGGTGSSVKDESKSSTMMEDSRDDSSSKIRREFRFSKIYGEICMFDSDDVISDKDMRKQCTTLSELENDLRCKEVKKRALASCPFELSSESTIAVKLYCTRRRATKESAQWLDARTNEPLTTHTRWLCTETGEYLDEFSLRTYYEFGPLKTKCFFNKTEVKSLKEFGSPSLVLLGFKPRSRLKPYMNLKPAYFMRPDETRIEGSTVCFNALLQSMHKLGQMAIARIIVRRSSGPKFVALLPQKAMCSMNDSNSNDYSSQNYGLDKAPGFNMIWLPYSDDIRKLKLWKLSRMKQCDPLKNPSVLSDWKSIMDRLCIKQCPLPSNPVIQRRYDALECLALDESIEEMNDEIVPDNDGIMRRVGDMLSQLKVDAADTLGDGSISSVAGGSSSSSSSALGKRKASDSGPQSSAKRSNVDSNAVDWRTLAQNDELGSMKVADLKVYLSENNLKKSGKKADIVQRIKDHLGVL